MLLINCRVESLFYQRKRIKNYQNSLAKDLKDQCIGINNDFNDFRKIKERRLKYADRNVTVLLKMENYEETRITLKNTQLNKLKSAAKNKTEKTLRITKKNLQDEELPREFISNN